MIECLSVAGWFFC